MREPTLLTAFILLIIGTIDNKGVRGETLDNSADWD
jgi:hypothetical protein